MRTINVLALPLVAVAGLALAADTWAQGRPGGGSGYRGGGSPGASGGRWQGGGRGAAPGAAVAPGRWSGGGYRGNTGYRGSGHAGGGYRSGYSGNGHGRYYGGHSHYGHGHHYGSAYWGWWGAAIAAPFLWAGYYGPWPYWSYTGYYGPNYYSGYYGPGYAGYPWVADAGYYAPSASEPVPTTEVPPLGAGAPTERPLYLNYCAEAQAYFPKVTTCAGGWQVRRPQY